MARNKGARALLIAALVATGCQDLDVVNTNAPDRDRALTSPADVETLIASTWRNFWSRWHNGSTTYNTMPLVADIMSGTYANDAALELSSEPRPALNNNPLSDAHAVMRAQWETFYQAISSANDGLLAINDGLRITTDGSDNTTRAWTFAKWAQGIGYGYLSLLFDKGLYGTENSELDNPLELPYLEYTEMRDSAIALLKLSQDTMQARSFTLPDTWINGVALTSAELNRLTHAYIARFYVYGARTPEERAALPWSTILDHLNKAITTDHTVAFQSGVLTSSLLSRMQTSGTFSAWGDYKAIGPADVSGTYQAWLAKPVNERERFQITTPDRRITGPTPTSNGAYYRYRADNIFRPERGTYHHSHYQWYRNGGRSSSGTYTIVSVDEMNLLKAEAHMHLGDNARAAELINTTRTRVQRIGSTNYPGLPAVTADGVPQSADCVPRTATGACGSLRDALIYERVIENGMLDGLIGYVDARGLGRLPPGTFVHLPIPAREAATLRIPVYTFGGVGGEGAAK